MCKDTGRSSKSPVNIDMISKLCMRPNAPPDLLDSYEAYTDKLQKVKKLRTELRNTIHKEIGTYRKLKARVRSLRKRIRNTETMLKSKERSLVRHEVCRLVIPVRLSIFDE